MFSLISYIGLNINPPLKMKLLGPLKSVRAGFNRTSYVCVGERGAGKGVDEGCLPLPTHPQRYCLFLYCRYLFSFSRKESNRTLELIFLPLLLLSPQSEATKSIQPLATLSPISLFLLFSSYLHRKRQRNQYDRFQRRWNEIRDSRQRSKY